MKPQLGERVIFSVPINTVLEYSDYKDYLGYVNHGVKIILQIAELKFPYFSWKMFLLSFLWANKNRTPFTDL